MKFGLALNGGGYRGLYSALILSELEQVLGSNIASKFNFVSGTSTGGILSCGVTVNNFRGDYLYSAEKIVDFYLQNKEKIFPQKSFFQKLFKNGLGLLDQKYPNDGLYDILSDLLGHAKLSSIKKNNLIVTSADTEKLTPLIFKSSNSNESCNDFYLRDVAMATAAAPTYFEPHFVQNGDREYSLVDGGVFAGNPVMCLFTEMLKTLKKNETVENDIFILNIGTGYSRKALKYNEVKNFGMLEWIRKSGGSPLFDLIFESTNAANIHFVENLIGKNLFVLDCELIDPKIQMMDNISDKQIEYLKKMAEKTIKENKPLFENLKNILN